MKFYRKLYYNLYLLWLRKKDEKSNAKINAVITLTFFSYINFLTIYLLIFAFWKDFKNHMPGLSNYKYEIVGVLTLIGILNYFHLGRKRNHDNIVREFSPQKNSYIINSSLYLIVSFMLPILIGILIAIFRTF